MLKKFLLNTNEKHKELERIKAENSQKSNSDDHDEFDSASSISDYE